MSIFPGRCVTPPICIGWDDARAYVAWLSEHSGVKYRLPSAAGWEFAARGGTSTAWYWGSTTEDQCRNANGADESTEFPWRIECSDGYAKTSLVGSYRSNAFGLHDVLGNACEWVQDCFNRSYVGAPADGSAWEEGGCASRVLRGASWASTSKYLRAAHRGGALTSFRGDCTGFRVARSL